jgi:hypothetical protein
MLEALGGKGLFAFPGGKWKVERGQNKIKKCFYNKNRKE